ncbi:isoprenylcysteine carboxyl methyltransferase family protein [Sediminibacillus massiliensis]|uniref:isoprenylcysteine carboxyl methyltransferase family protein n=1 Tax=Sediminibacillus massiliensis TaxID=1926277 RepID=UPI0009887F90|nr:isoprenylcysteine carboxylmethyltransferase family protein [Sediminibacillus massiliensis]
MNLWMWGLLLFLVVQRLAELAVARSNEKWIKSKGGYEEGAGHYKWFVIVHSLFFIFLLVESLLRHPGGVALDYRLFILFILAQLFRVWCITSLGRFWNTKILILPGADLVAKGPYKMMKHPNYVIVGIELFIIPLLFQAYLTAVLFPIIHLLLLVIRIPEEEKALARLKNR